MYNKWYLKPEHVISGPVGCRNISPSREIVYFIQLNNKFKDILQDKQIVSEKYQLKVDFGNVSEFVTIPTIHLYAHSFFGTVHYLVTDEELIYLNLVL